MGVPREPTYSLLVIACFSRHREALGWATTQLMSRFGNLALKSQDFPFHHTKYYDQAMGTGLIKRFLVFDELAAADCLADVKHFTIGKESELAATGMFPDQRPLNLDPGLVQLGKFLLASTKDQGHRVYLRDGIFAEVTLRYQGGQYEPWPWTYADYREDDVRAFLGQARTLLYERVRKLRETQKNT